MKASLTSCALEALQFWVHWPLTPPSNNGMHVSMETFTCYFKNRKCLAFEASCIYIVLRAKHYGPTKSGNLGTNPTIKKRKKMVTLKTCLFPILRAYTCTTKATQLSIFWIKTDRCWVASLSNGVFFF